VRIKNGAILKMQSIFKMGFRLSNESSFISLVLSQGERILAGNKESCRAGRSKLLDFKASGNLFFGSLSLRGSQAEILFTEKPFGKLKEPECTEAYSGSPAYTGKLEGNEKRVH
jgi:hypothetical protein